MNDVVDFWAVDNLKNDRNSGTNGVIRYEGYSGHLSKGALSY